MRAGVSAYIEAFVLIGVAVGGAGLVFGAASSYGSSIQGTSVSLGAVSVRQGSYAAVERVTVYDSGDSPISAFTLSNQGVSNTALYCYTLTLPPSVVAAATNCPPTNAGPSTVHIPFTVKPGQSLLVDVTFTGRAFAVGSTASITVTTSDGAQASVSALVVGA